MLNKSIISFQICHRIIGEGKSNIFLLQKAIQTEELDDKMSHDFIL